MPTVKLRTKLVAGSLTLIFLLGLAMFIFIKVVLTNKLESKLQQEGIYLAKHFASMCVDPLLSDQPMQLTLMFFDFIRHTDRLEYIFVVDHDNALGSHTFSRSKFPEGLKKVNQLKRGQDYNIVPIRLNQKKFFDIAAPILEGELGTLHVGVSEIHIQEIVTETTRPFLLVISFFLLISALLALFLAKYITKPLADLVSSAEKVSRGDLKTRVAVTTGDELGVLGETFNRMQENLLTTLTSLNEYQENLEQKVLDRTIELQNKNTEIETNRSKLKNSLDEVSRLITTVIKEKKFGSYHSSPELQRCWEVEKCDRKECPCYGKEPMRCWHVEGSHCRKEIQGGFEEKFESCKECNFYQISHADPLTQIGEHFNDMMFILERKNKKLEDAHQKLKENQATIFQQEKMASVGQLAAGVAHEINNPMGFISSNLRSLDKYFNRIKEYLDAQSQALVDEDREQTDETLKGLRKKLKLDFILEDTQDLIAESQDGANRVKEIVQNLKSFSRVDQEALQLTDINDCLESTINMVWNELKYNCEVVREYGELPLTQCYPQLLNQVFVNLLVNGSHAIKDKGVITVKTWAEKSTISVAISDTGQGIPQENINKLFEPFFTTKEVGKGTGLGLSIAYDIVTEKHQGEITVESEVGKGTTFTVIIPVVDPDQKKPGEGNEK